MNSGSQIMNDDGVQCNGLKYWNSSEEKANHHVQYVTCEFLLPSHICIIIITNHRVCDHIKQL